MKKVNPAVALLLSQLNQVVSQSPSPLMIWLAPVVRSVEEGELTFEFTVQPVMTNPSGNLHGGAIAAIMDDMIGATIISLNKSQLYTTINNSIDYFAAAKPGDIVTGKTQVTKQGREIINVGFELWNLAKKRLLAKGSSNCLRTALTGL